MLRISKLADYSTVIMVYLAKQGELLCNARDIAVHTHLSLPTVSKVLKRLTASGLLASVRGANGGYRLQRSPSDISVANIIDALEGKSSLVECGLLPNSCSLQGVCLIQGNWRLISHAIEMALDSVSLEALAKPMLTNGAEIKKIQQIASNLSYGE